MQEQNRASFRRMQEVQVIAIRHFFFRKLRRNVRTATQRDFSSPLIAGKRREKLEVAEIPLFDVILKEKRAVTALLTGCFTSLQKAEGETTLFSKIYSTMRAFPDNRFVFV